jgi:uncharacterized MnhB-related membrane protein
MVINILLGLAVVAALVAVEIRDLYRSVAAFGVMGLALCLSFLALGSFDLALLQLGVEIALLVYIIRATRPTGEQEPGQGWGIAGYLAAVVLVIVFAVFAAWLVGLLPAAAARGTKGWALNPYNLLGIAAVLLGAVLGALAVLRSGGRREP